MTTSTQLTGIRKAAILLALVGEDAASEMYRHLSDEDVQGLTQELAEVSQVPPDVAVQVLEEYARLTATQDLIAQAGSDYAKRLLVKAFGDEGARQLLLQVSRSAELSTAKL